MITIYKSNSMADAARFVMDALKRVDKTNLSITHTVIVPDRASLEAERALLKAVGGSFNTQVKTFRRLAADVLPKYDYLSKQAGIMALSMIIKERKSELRCYVKGVETAGFIEEMYDTISMMKYCKITPQMLQKAELPPSVAGKARDIAMLYQAYLDFTEGRFIDSADKLDLLRECIANSDVTANGFYYLYDFDNFTAQELSIIEQLALKSKGVVVACCVGKTAADKYLYLDDIFNGVVEMCKRNNIAPNVVESERKYANECAAQIGEHLYRYNAKKATPSADFIEIYQSSTRVNEVYALACRVQRYVRAGGRFKDVYVVTSDVAKYSNAISTVFSQFDIPYFCDRQFVLSDHPYARFVLDYLAVARNNAKLPFVLPFVKNYLFCGNFDGKTAQDDVFFFENYCLKYNVSYRYNSFGLGKDEPYFQRADAFRRRFYELYKNNPIPSEATVAEYVQLVRKLIDYAKLAEKNIAFSIEQQHMGWKFESKVTSQAQEKFESVLLQAENVVGTKLVKLDEFIRLLTAGVASVKISVIPVRNDCVVFANMAKARKHDIKFLALLGANQGAMPIVKSDCRLLSDRNIKDLVGAGINVEPQIHTENKRERFSLFQLLLEPTEKLYVSYTTTDGANSLLPSPFINEFAQLFTVNKKPLAATDEADEDVYTVKQAIEKVVLNNRRLADSQIVKMPSYDVLSQKFAAEVAKYTFAKDGKEVSVARGGELYLKNSATSVSQLKTFFDCPYSFYFRYGLNIQPRPVAELKSADLGTILHDVLENYVRVMDVNEDDATTTQLARKFFAEAMSSDFYKSMLDDNKMSGVLAQLESESVRMCRVVKKQLLASNFRNEKTELEFGIKDGAPAVVVKFNGGQFNLKGKIDRLDVQDDKKRFIVIDYKSGATASSYTEKDLYIGHKLQLLVYVKAVEQLYPDLRPAGFYYFTMHDNFVDLDDATEYTYNGRTLNDVDVACDVDTELSKGQSKKLGLKLKVTDKGTSIDGRAYTKLMTDEQFDHQTEYAYRLIARAGELMHKGYAAVSPYDKACAYCDFRSICDFGDAYTYDARKVEETVNKNTIAKSLGKFEEKPTKKVKK